MFAIFKIKFQDSNNFKNDVRKMHTHTASLHHLGHWEYSVHEYFSDITLNLYWFAYSCNVLNIQGF